MFHLPWCEFRCAVARFGSPHELIASPWIRPEDVHVYEERGVTRLKLVDRCSPTDLLARIVEAYRRGSYDGNLADLLPGLQGVRRDRLPLQKMARHFFKPLTFNVLKGAAMRDAPKRPEVFIDNRKLDGFLEHFFEKDCRLHSCEACGYCARVAREVLRVPPGQAEQMTSRMAKYLDELASGELFRY